MAEQISDKIEETTSDEQIDKMASDEQIDETTLDEQIDKTVSDEQIDETTSDEQIKKILTKARFLFAIQSLHAMMILKMKKNVAFSPYSIYEGLLLVYLASSNDTEKQLRCKLHLPDNDNVQNMITNWILHTTERRNTEEELPNYNKINSCWIANNKVVNNIAQNLFKDNLKVVNFCNVCDNVETQINEFLRRKTEDYIHPPVQINNINKEMEIILSTVLCSKGDIAKQNVSTEAGEMHSLKKPRSFISSKLRMIVTELPFADRNLSLFVLYPAWQFMMEWLAHDDMWTLVTQLCTEEGIDELLSVLNSEESSEQFRKREQVLYPDFFEWNHIFKIDKLLKKLGIKNLLKPKKATLSKFTKKKLHLGNAVHRSYIKVTRDNVVAGTVNMFFTKKEASINLSKKINYSACTKKFLWLLYCKESQTILFSGYVNKYKSALSHAKHKTLIDTLLVQQCNLM